MKNSFPWRYAKLNKPVTKKTNTVQFHFYEVARRVKNHKEKKTEVTTGWGKGHAELVINIELQFLQGWKHLHNNVSVLNSIEMYI